jgi:hypothetical protein
MGNNRQSDLLKTMRIRALILPAFIAVCIGAGMQGQTPPPATQQTPPATQQTPPAATPAPLPGQKPTPAPDPNTPPPADKAVGLAGTAVDQEEKQADANGQPAAGEYTGPSILSRGFNFARPAVPTQVRFRPFVGLNAIFDSGLTGPFLGPTGKVISTSSFAIDGNFGISGRKYLPKQVFELDYRGHLYYYAGNTKFNGQDHAFSAGYTRYMSSRLLLSIHETAGLYSNNYAVLNSTANSDISTGNVSLVVSPNTESFDSRTFYSSTEVDAVYQKSARLSFNIGASGFLVERGSKSLVNSRGYQARADTGYRVSKNTTIGVYYAYTFYSFPHVYGNSDSHSVGLDYSVALNKHLSLKIRGGASRVEVQGLTSVTLDPLVAAILGQSLGFERFYQVSYIPDVSAALTKTLAHSSIGVSFAQGVSPGNGLYLTSRHESESVYYQYDGIRTYSISASSGRDTLLSIGGVVGSYASYFGRLGVSHPIARRIQATLSGDYRHLGFSQSGYGRNEYRISLGLTFAPGEGPLKFW